MANSSSSLLLYGLRHSLCVTLYSLVMSSQGYAQVAGDTSVSTQVFSSDQHNFVVTGGQEVGGNLFHSFQEFSVPTQGSVHFDHSPGIEIILSRVSGSSPSMIDGVIQTNGTTDLFLLNPNGIVFGSNAQLDIGGSFIATTAEEIIFEDGTSFSSLPDPSNDTLLTVTAPVGVQFGTSPAPIENRSSASVLVPGDPFSLPFGLQVSDSHTLALIGGDIIFEEGGTATISAGNLELGAVDQGSYVGLIQTGDSWSLNYDLVDKFRDITLSNSAIGSDSFFQAQDTQDSKFRLVGRRILMLDRSSIQGPSIPIILDAEELVHLQDQSGVFSFTFSDSPAGDITISAPILILEDSSTINSTSQPFSAGQGGNITLDISDSLEVKNSAVVSTSLGSGQAGNIEISTDQLVLQDGGSVSSSAEGAGTGGSILIDAQSKVEIRGEGEFISSSESFLGPSRIATETIGADATGSGGLLQVITDQLIIAEGGLITASSRNGSLGQAGQIRIEANQVDISGFDSSISATSESPSGAGQLSIQVENLSLSEGGTIDVSSTGNGNAGDLIINAATIDLKESAQILSITTGGQGNIVITTQDLRLDQSGVRTDASGDVNGGNISIDAGTIVLLNVSDITANAEGGNGGNISITTEGLFQSDDSAITATSEQGIDGVVTIIVPGSDPGETLIQLSATPQDAPFPGQGCRPGRLANRFVVIGRGGLAPSPYDLQGPQSSWQDLRPLDPEILQIATADPSDQQETLPSDPSHLATTDPSSDPESPLIEAQGFGLTPDGELILTAETSRLGLEENDTCVFVLR